MPSSNTVAADSSLLEDEYVDAVEAQEAKEKQYGDIQQILESATRGSNQYLHPKTATKWFQEALSQERPRTYFEFSIRPRMKAAEEMRRDYDSVTRDLEKKGSTGSFSVLPPDSFWKLKSKDRAAYIESAKEYLKGPKNFESRWAKIADEVRNFAKITFNELGAASASETEALLDGLKYKPQDEAELQGWETYVNGEMKKQITFARRLYFEELMDPLLRELKNKTISERVLKEMDKKFRDKNASYKSKEAYVQKVLPQRIAEWKKVKAQRDRLIKDPDIKRLTTAKVPNLHKFLNEDAFVNMTFPERKGLADMVESVLLSQGSNMEALHENIKTELQEYVSDGRMHRTKVGTWLNRIFTKNATPQMVQTFMESTVRPFARNWQKVRRELDAVNRMIKIKGLPRGMHQRTLNEFLLLEYPQRVTYVEEMRSRLESDVNEPGELNNLIVSIRHNFDTHDWEEAEELLEKAKKMDAEDPRIQSMQRYLDTHRPKIVEEQEHQEADELVAELREYLHHVPGRMGKAYAEAMQRGPGAIASLMVGTYNLVWVHEHRYSDPLKDKQAAKDEANQEQTRHYIENGHSRKLEHNILDGDTANHHAIRDECRKAQVIHIGNDEGYHAVVDKFEQNQDNALFKYWSTLHFDDVAYEEHRMVVRNLNYKIKTGMRALDTMGYRFTLSGAPQKK